MGADTGISKSEVSRICAELDVEVAAFRDRSLAGQPFRYVFLDATYCKARVNHRVVSQAVVVATGVAADGRREVLGFDVGDSEDGAFWTAFLRSLKTRGLGGVATGHLRRPHRPEGRDQRRVPGRIVAALPGPLPAQYPGAGPQRTRGDGRRRRPHDLRPARPRPRPRPARHHRRDQGLTTRPTANRPVQPVSLNKLHQMLRDDYYTGVVTYQGESYPGRHDPLVSRSLFERVQDVLEERSRNGQRDRVLTHYLKGLLLCERCHARAE